MRSRGTSTGRGLAPGSAAAERAAAAVEERALGGVLGAGDRRVVRGSRLAVTSEPSQQVRSDRVLEMMAVERERVDEREAGLRAVQLRDCDGAVERHDGARRDSEVEVVQRDDLPPVGL